MNSKGIVVIAAGVFVGVFVALQMDRLLFHREDRPASASSRIALLPETPANLQPTVLDGPGEGTLDFRAAAKKVVPSVVSVDRYERVQRFFFDNEGVMDKTGTGSGVILSSDGVIVTNNHVVADQQGNVVPELRVRLHDKRSFKAKVLGTDPVADLAVLKINASNLSPIELGNSSSVEVGQWVMAVGNPLGFDDTVSVGVVSSLKRDLPVGAVGLVNAIQTDAAINPGNSGGALTDQHGRLVGINSAIASPTRASVGIGFAIPIDQAKVVVNEIIQYGHARYADLGVLTKRELDGILTDSQSRDEFSQETNVQNPPDHGVIVLGASGSAGRAGIGQYDVLLSVDGTPVDTSFDLNKILLQKKPGQKVHLKWWSKGSLKSATVALQEIGGSVD